MPQTYIKFECNAVRAEITLLSKRLLKLREDPVMNKSPGAPEPGPDPDVNEMHANLMLAFRHLEDARMRIGKIIQAQGGGQSIYDRGA